MRRTLAVRAESWPLRRAFAIARGRKTTADVVVAEIGEDGLRGRGECVPYARYGESVEAVMAAIDGLGEAIAGGMETDELASVLPAGAARNALDCALWDLAAKRAGCRAWDLAGLPAPPPVLSAETISLDTPAAMAAAAAVAAVRDAGAEDGAAAKAGAGTGVAPLLKVKVGGDGVFERVAAIRVAAPTARLIVDANEGWTLAMLERLSEPLAALGVEMIEQPLPAGDDAALAGFSSPVVLCADESCHGIGDLDRLAGCYGMVNVKLDKTGGLSEALRLSAAARERGFAVMVGCMVATSLAMAPATLLAATAAVVDLDGPLWLVRDRAPPIGFAGGTISPPAAALWG